KILGTQNMRVFSFFVPNGELDKYRDEVFRRMERMIAIAKAEGIRLCHENEARIYGEAPERVKDLLDNLDGLLGVFDAANYIMGGFDPIVGLTATRSKLEYLHVKDAVAETRQIVPVGMGDGCYGHAIETVNGDTDKTVFLTVEPHLKKFLAYNSIDDRELKTKLSFENSDESFDFAVESLKNTLKSLGYKEDNYTWTR
ncbi:MAG: TIM barrel protein, partial [Clostridia bacterium]|nr:TIM barrel protein [Clostridia bacterium]